MRSRWLDIGQVFFACFLTETESKSITRKKKEQGQYLAMLTEKVWSIKDSLFGYWGNFSRGTRWVVPNGQDSSILPTRVANILEKLHT